MGNQKKYIAEQQVYHQSLLETNIIFQHLKRVEPDSTNLYGKNKATIQSDQKPSSADI